MIVELRPYCAPNMYTKKMECFKLWHVYAGDHPEKIRFVGVLGWRPEHKIQFHVPVSPIEEEAICKEVSRQLKREAESIAFPELPEEFYHQQEENPFDEFNESDLT